MPIIIKFFLYRFFILKYTGLQPSSLVLKLTMIRILLGLLVGFLIFFLPEYLGIIQPSQGRSLGFKPYLLFLLIPARPLEWWTLSQIASSKLNYNFKNQGSFIIKASGFSFLIDAVFCVTMLLGFLSVGGLC